MKFQAPRKLAFLLSETVACVTLSTKSAPAPAIVVPLGTGAYSITRTASNGFDRNIEQLKAEAKAEAEKYCASQGKQLKVESLTADKPLFALGYASAKIVFRALDPGEVALSDPATSITPSEKPTPTGNLYNDLIKLDDLRKRGLLTEDEFQSEKKKALGRSQ